MSLLIGFYAMLRTGELLQLRASHILCSKRQRQALLSLGMTKGGKRHGASESVVLGYEDAYRFTQRWTDIAPSSAPLARTPAKWRSLFSQALEALGLQDHEFRPYSLRRGGATFWFQRHQSMDQILVQGRWHTPKSARIYLNEGLAVLAQMTIRTNDPKIKPYLDVFSNVSHTLNFSTLEPPPKGGRAGASGRNKKSKSKKSRKENAHYFC